MSFRIFCFVFSFLLYSLAFSQSDLQGIVKDSSGTPYEKASIKISNSEVIVESDADGMFYLENVNVGDELFITHPDANSLKVVLESKDLTAGIINITLPRITNKKESNLEQVTVSVGKKTNTDASVLKEMKEAKQVVSAISAEQISKTADNNAAESIKRIPGVTVVDGRFIMVRGIPERYNSVMINNSIAPSTEVDKRTFSFDLIPSSIIDNVQLFKSGSADIPGDFAGSVIKILTTDRVSNFNRINLGFGYRFGTTFDEIFQSEKSSTDFLGFDWNFRPLPSSFPSSQVIIGSPRNSLIRQNAAHLLPNNFVAESRDAFLDWSIGYALGRNFSLKSGKRIETINGLSYSLSYLTFDRKFNRYLALGAGETVPADWLDFNDRMNQENVRLTLVSNWILHLNENNRIKFKNLVNQIGENETILRSGRNILQRPTDDFQNYYLGYRSRLVYMGAFSGLHKLNEKSKLDWVFGGNIISDQQPDLRRFRTFRTIGSTGNFTIVDPPSSNLFDNSRYYGELLEFSANQSTNYTYKFSMVENPIELRAGYLVDFKSRTFDSRYFSYLIPGYISFDRATELRNLPLSTIFSNTYVNATDGWVLEEGTRPIDSYDATNLLSAGYVFMQYPWGRFNFSGGLRVEHNIQKLNSRDDFGPVTVENPVTSFLPSLNVGYNLNEKNILRFAYSRTVNRPEFREIAPFLFYDFQFEAAFVGKPNLKVADIDNLDIRYEIYPRSGETISIGAFYKHFTNPIENITILTTEQPQFTFANASHAYNYGVELEARKSFKDVFTSQFLQRFSINLNASYIYSQVDLGDNAGFQDRKRPLQGQSPYIINAMLSYQDEKDFQVNFVYNRFGNRIFSVGDVVFPTIWELPRDSFDVTLSKRINRFTYKLSVEDVFNAPFRFYEDTDRSNAVKGSIDQQIVRFQRGTRLFFNISYNF